MRMLNRFLIILIGIVFIGCNELPFKSQIKGVWKLEKRVNKQYVDDDFFGTQYPTLFDFKSEGDLYIKNFGYQDTLYSWKFISDSVMLFMDKEFHIKKINNEEMVVEFEQRNETYLYFFTRPYETNLTLPVESIKAKLIGKTWTVTDTTGMAWMKNFEYFKNGIAIYRYDVKKNNTQNLQDEIWGVENYKGYTFLYHRDDLMTGNGNIMSNYQLLDVKDKSYVLLNNDFESREIQFKAKEISSHNKKKLIIGSWVSKNDASEFYGKYLSQRAIGEGLNTLFDGNLYFDFSSSYLDYRLEAKDTYMKSWILSEDGKTIVTGSPLSDGYVKGERIDYYDVLEVSETDLIIKLYHSSIYDSKDSTNYLLNIIQRFKRVIQ